PSNLNSVCCSAFSLFLLFRTSISASGSASWKRPTRMYSCSSGRAASSQSASHCIASSYACTASSCSLSMSSRSLPSSTKSLARARRRRVELLLLEVARGAIPIGFVDRDRAQRGQGRQMRRIEVERHLEALLRLPAITQLVFECLTDAVVHLDALIAIGSQVRDAGHRLDRLRGVALLFVQLAQRFERGHVR